MFDRFRKLNHDSKIYLLLAVLNVTIGCFLIYTSPVDTGSDTGIFIDIASALVGKGGNISYTRTWGYPILLILTGFPWLHWPIFPQLVQLVLGSAIPYFVGSSLRQLGVGSRICIAAATVSFLSLSPVIWSTALLTDEDAEFLFYFAIWLMACSLARTEASTQSGTLWKFAAAISSAFFLLYLVRPANALLGFVALGVASTIGKNGCRRLMLRGITVLVLLTLAWIPLQKSWGAWAEVKAKHSFQMDGSMAGTMFFWSIYSAGSTFAGRSTIRPNNGPCSSSIYDALRKYSEPISSRIYGKSVSAEQALADHTLMNHAVIWLSVEKDFGPRKMDHIFWCAAFEGIAAEPKSILFIYDGLVSFFLISDVDYGDGSRQAWSSSSIEAMNSLNAPLWAWALYVGTIIKVTAFLTALLTLVPTLQFGGNVRILALAVWGMLLYHAAIHVVFAEPLWRYSSVAIPGLVFLAALGSSVLLRGRTRDAAGQSFAVS
jgi:hypothetical protein